MAMHVVALDDYQGLVAEYGLDGQPDGARWTAIREHLAGCQSAALGCQRAGRGLSARSATVDL